MLHSSTRWTAQLLEDLPNDGRRYEVIDGELFVTPSPANVHQRAVRELFLLLAAYANRVGVDVLFAPASVRWSERREVQPDLFATPLMADGQPPERFSDVGELLLVVEVLSQSTRRTDRHKKRVLYQDEHVADYWIIDLDARAIEHWTPEATAPRLLTTTLEWQPVEAQEVLLIDIAKYFRSVLGK